ncbi:SMP-30/gluconolactonase/LRE family protein [Rhizobium sp. ZPR3]|uniref:SMP-30/gluconolactonase/LRE family protein n=2 Tax=unclassified Rhizobium TaxID=2613769 RepID=A0AAU7SPX0_9HYPH
MRPFGEFLDRFLGRGAWAVTVPTFDGPLLPNQKLEEAETLALLEAADNLISTPKGILVSSGKRLLRIQPNGGMEEVASFPQDITALATARGMTAVALDGEGVAIRGGAHDGAAFKSTANVNLNCVTALTFLNNDTLLVANGSTTSGVSGWRRDLMQKGCSGSLLKIDLGARKVDLVKSDLAWPAGVATTGSNRIFVSEAWRHRVISIDLASGQVENALEHLPAYPARIAPAVDAGYWLTFYSTRNQLVEFILREDRYRERMLAEVPEAFWMAPSLSSWSSYQEPMQGSQLKQMGVLKPYAVTRSYGLVVNCDSQMRPLASFHSRADGKAHGTVAACEHGDDLIVASRGGSKVLRLFGAANGQRG